MPDTTLVDELPVQAQVLCRQCAAVLPVEQGTQFVTCAFCSATNFVDKGRTVFHYVVRETVRENDAVAALRRWMAGNDTVKGLDSQAKIEPPLLELFPMWLIRTAKNGQETVVMEPAAALSVSELKHLTVPAADLQPYHEVTAAITVAPTVPYDMMLQWLANDYQVQPHEIREVSLVHLPIYYCKYEHQGRRYTAVVDAATSRVFANIYPSKWEMPYFAIGTLAFVVYFCAALIPLGGFMLGEGTGLLLGTVIYFIVAIILAIPIFIAAAVVSARV
jgi:LSD1 subclass zinc finger protein